MSNPANKKPNPIFIAESETDGVQEIHDLYWFEENGIRTLDGEGHFGEYQIKGTVETVTMLLLRLTDDERKIVMYNLGRELR